jgi:DNA polymerase III sliding clamp (beta) subunit (PCNA family)
VLIAFDKSKGHLTIGATELAIRLLEGDYPQYRHIIPN